MRHPASVLQSIQRQQKNEWPGKRYALLGANPYVKGWFRRLIAPRSTVLIEENVDPAGVRQSLLRINDVMQTTPFQWELPLLWIEGSDHVFSAMAFPEDFPISSHIVVCCSETEEVYIPPSFIAVSIAIKGAGAPLQELLKWVLVHKGMSAEIEVLRFLAGEYKENLLACEKLIDQLYLRIHPRTMLVMKDLETDASLEWDCELIIKALLEGDEGKVLKEFNQALKTFHPKGIVTVLSRRVLLLAQIAQALVLSSGQPDPAGDIRPWVWRNNLELVKDIPPSRLFKWTVALDKAYATLSRGSVSHRWTLFNMMSEMSRV
jgi:hypothetical protein